MRKIPGFYELKRKYGKLLVKNLSLEEKIKKLKQKLKEQEEDFNKKIKEGYFHKLWVIERRKKYDFRYLLFIILNRLFLFINKSEAKELLLKTISNIDFKKKILNLISQVAEPKERIDRDFELNLKLFDITIETIDYFLQDLKSFIKNPNKKSINSIFLDYEDAKIQLFQMKQNQKLLQSIECLHNGPFKLLKGEWNK